MPHCAVLWCKKSSKNSNLNTDGVTFHDNMTGALTALIKRHTLVSRRHLTPELALRLITPHCELWSARTSHPFNSDPFWAFYWPGGQALTRYILDGAEHIKYKRILDVGSGCGACSIASVKSGAKFTLANDIDEYAIAAIHLNAKLNEVTLKTSKEDFIGTGCDDFDTILIGDMFYDEDFARILFTWLEELALNDKTVLIGDPGRHGLTDKRRKHLKLLTKYRLPKDSLMENNGFRHVLGTHVYGNWKSPKQATFNATNAIYNFIV